MMVISNRNSLLLLASLFALVSLTSWSSPSQASIASTEEELAYAREVLPALLKRYGMSLTPNSMSLRPSRHIVKLADDALESVTSWFLPTREWDYQVLTFRATNAEGLPFNGWTYLLVIDENTHCSGAQGCDSIKNHPSAKRIVTSIHNEPVFMRFVGDVQGPHETIAQNIDPAHALHLSPQCSIRIGSSCKWRSHPY